MDKRKVIYYTDELHDEFSVAQITPRTIDESYTYCHDSAWKRFTHFFWYRMVFTPIAYAYVKLVFGHRTVGGERLRAFRGQGYFLYGNHTQDIGDAFIPNVLNCPQENYVIVHPNNVSMPLLGRITPSLGALPLPDNMRAYKNFLQAVERRISEGHSVVIYPEAHIWPYYTGIRPFTDESFHYPVRLGMPVFCFTNTYQKRRFSREPRIVSYIDGPFYPDETLSVRERRRELRDRVYEAMCERAKRSDMACIQYIKKEEENHG
ncbi:MAG: 1-acyl-sn-glycerol-3-phosphate acyltransferase [Clostridia bacterium]|nr:1-acyl-sn-glycerol-3-phosphate acyltransferase [Clostridia bacterium]